MTARPDPRAPRRGGPGRATLALVYLAFLWLLVEAAAAALAWLPATRASLFSDGEAFVAQLEGAEPRYREFLAGRYDGVLGWDNPRGGTGTFPACGEGTVTATYLDDRSRWTGDAGAGPPILAMGDSYTRGDGVPDGASYPAQLARRLGRPVVNHGVGGYGPVQAVLKFQRVARQYPGARSAVLGIVDDDLFRMLNSYRPVYFPNTAGMFAFQPYMRGAVRQPNPNGPEPAPYPEFLARVRRAFREDYWALAAPRFPYSWALLDSLARPGTRLRLLALVDFARVLGTPEVRIALGAVVTEFVDSAEGAGIAPVVLFIPHAPAYRGVFDALVAELGRRFGSRAVVAAVHDARYRWDRYLRHPHCHPTPYGYGMIAEEAARAIRDAETRGGARPPSTPGAPTP